MSLYIKMSVYDHSHMMQDCCRGDKGAIDIRLSIGTTREFKGHYSILVGDGTAWKGVGEVARLYFHKKPDTHSNAGLQRLTSGPP